MVDRVLGAKIDVPRTNMDVLQTKEHLDKRQRLFKQYVEGLCSDEWVKKMEERVTTAQKSWGSHDAAIKFTSSIELLSLEKKLFLELGNASDERDHRIKALNGSSAVLESTTLLNSLYATCNFLHRAMDGKGKRKNGNTFASHSYQVLSLTAKLLNQLQAIPQFSQKLYANPEILQPKDLLDAAVLHDVPEDVVGCGIVEDEKNVPYLVVSEEKPSNHLNTPPITFTLQKGAEEHVLWIPAGGDIRSSEELFQVLHGRDRAGKRIVFDHELLREQGMVSYPANGASGETLCGLPLTEASIAIITALTKNSLKGKVGYEDEEVRKRAEVQASTEKILSIEDPAVRLAACLVKICDNLANFLDSYGHKGVTKVASVLSIRLAYQTPQLVQETINLLFEGYQWNDLDDLLNDERQAALDQLERVVHSIMAPVVIGEELINNMDFAATAENAEKLLLRPEETNGRNGRYRQGPTGAMYSSN